MQISEPHTSLPKQDPAAHVPGTPRLGQYQPIRALRAAACVRPTRTCRKRAELPLDQQSGDPTLRAAGSPVHVVYY